MAEHHDTFHHVRDFTFFELPEFLGGKTDYLPRFGDDAYPFRLQLTKFMLLQVVASLLVFLVFAGLAWHIRRGRPARGAFWNFWEMLALFIRDQVVRPAIGTGHDHGHDDHGAHLDAHGHPLQHEAGHDAHGRPTHVLGAPEVPGPAVGKTVAPIPTGSHPADKYLPYVWTCFFYILFCNLLGALPWLGSATGHISVTAMLALTTFLVVIIAGMRKLGVVGYWKSIVPSMDLPPAIAFALVPVLWVIELVGLLIKHTVLAVRLFANILGGHTALAVILGFIAAAGSPMAIADYGDWMWWLVAPASIIGQVAIGLLELFVAFLQAYVFSLLTALFIGMAIHPH